LGGPSVAQGPCVGLARVESDKCFVFNAADEKGVGARKARLIGDPDGSTLTAEGGCAPRLSLKPYAN
jgi:hypothetical protein